MFKTPTLCITILITANRQNGDTTTSQTAYAPTQATYSSTGEWSLHYSHSHVVWLTARSQVMNLMKWVALRLELLPLACKQELLNFPLLHGRCWVPDTQSHQPHEGQPTLSTVSWNATTLHPHCSPYSNRTLGPQHRHTTRSMQGTGCSQRGSRWWIYHLEGGSCYCVWKHVTLFNQILLFTYFLFTCGKSKYYEALLFH